MNTVNSKYITNGGTHTRNTSAYKSNGNLAKLIVAFTVVTLALAIVVAVLANELNKKNLILENNYSQSLYDASANLDNIEIKLSKLTISNSDTQKLLLTNDIWRQAQNVAADLAALPLEHSGVVNTTRFVNQLGDYTYYLGKKLSSKQPITEEEMQVLESFYSNCAIVNQEMKALLQKMGSKYRIINHLDEQKALKPKDTLSGNFGDIQKQLEDYPELIYDGPFADSNNVREYKCLEPLAEVSQEEGEAMARRMLEGYNISQIRCGMSGSADFYELSVTVNGNREVYMQVSKKGAKPIMFATNRDIGAANVSAEQAKTYAIAFANKAGLGELKPVWIDVNGNVAYINLVPEIQNVIHYPDMVKVKVALDDGEILGLESTNYLLHHIDREASELTPTIDEETAAFMISPKLEISNIRLALIPLGQRELLTYEIYCANGGLNYFIYINAHNGNEENIMRVIDTEQGTLLE